MKIDFDFSTPAHSIKACRKRLAAYSLARIAVFLLLLAVAIVGVAEASGIVLLFFPLCFLFIYLVLKFNLEKDRESFFLALMELKSNKAERSERKLGTFDPGVEFLEKNHPFANDLDIFGTHSLFQLINHTVSVGGKKVLAGWLLSETDIPSAKKRHNAVLELSTRPDYLEKFEALGKAFLKEEKSKSAFFEWTKQPSEWKSWFWIPAVTGPVVGLILLPSVLFGLLDMVYLSLFLLVGMFFLSLVFKPLLASMKMMPNDSDLKTYKAWSYLLEEVTFKDPYLLSLQRPVSDINVKASAALKSLEQQSFLVQSRANLMYLIFNFLFWVDFLVLYRLEKWKQRYGDHAQQWERTFYDWEAMVSLGAYSVEENHEVGINWTHEEVLTVKNIRHPLIVPAKCIGNDFELGREQQIVLLTGSNMSGKTTFMRTLGINLVMANVGLKPLADSFLCGPFRLYTSMRNADNLGESVSSFYAELSRIKGLIERAAGEYPIFFLLDEILKGTNTTDRVMGSEALIKQLLDTPSKGLISTHDMELTTLFHREKAVRNMSFHHDIRHDEIIFDYKIKNGPCPSFNAHKLMELMGIRFG